MAGSAPQFLLHHDGDSVAVAVMDLLPGSVNGAALKGGTKYSFDLLAACPLGHKFAAVEIKNGDDIIKYGVRVGVATADIKVGEYVHVHNMRSARWQLSRA